MRAFFLALLILFILYSPGIAAMPESITPDHVEARLRRQVEFWVKIYSAYSNQQGLLHDSKYVDIVYEVGSTHQAQAMRERWRKVLLSLHEKEIKSGGGVISLLSRDEKRVWDLFVTVQEPERFLRAAHRKRLRFQQGQAESFKRGIYESGKYLPYMEAIFLKEGLPLELTRLPFVESSFNLKAYSKVGASGIWQFIRSTGKLFLRIDEAVDERNDPIRATEAAAKLLKQNFESLKSWPLAVTAYNHGRLGLMRAVRTVGSEDFNDVLDLYRGRAFGFASTNFFACLLAAITIDKTPIRHFGKEILRSSPLQFFEVKLPDYILLKDLVQFLSLNKNQIRELNPALTEGVYVNQLRVPKGYFFRLPLKGWTEEERLLEEKIFFAGYEKIPRIFKYSTQL